MTVTSQPLTEYKFIETVEATQFTAVNTTIIDAVSVTNISSAAVKLNLSVVAIAGSAGDVNRAIKDRVIRVGETYLCLDILGQVLLEGDFVSAIAETASALNIRISGRVIT